MWSIYNPGEGKVEKGGAFIFTVNLSIYEETRYIQIKRMPLNSGGKRARLEAKTSTERGRYMREGTSSQQE